MAQAPALPTGFELPLEPRLPRIGSVDAVALEERSASLAKRSIKKDAKVFALELAIRCMDLTTLEGADTPGKVAALCSKAVRPDPTDGHIPSVAAVCVYPNLVPTALERLRGTGVKVASVATAFPSGQAPRQPARDGRRRRLHQDLDGKAPERRDPAGRTRDARGDPRRSRRDRPDRRIQARRRHSQREAVDPASRPRARDARRRLADARSVPAGRVVAPER